MVTCSLFTWLEPERIVRSGANITLNYIDQAPGSRDIRPMLQLQVFCPVNLTARSSQTSTKPILKFPFLDTMQPGSTITNGSVTIGPLIQLVYPTICEVVLYKKRYKTMYVPFSVGSRIIFQVRGTLTQPRLSLSPAPHSLYLTWKGLEKKNITSVMYHPKLQAQSWTIAHALKRTYTREDMCGAPANRDRPDFNLGPVTTYRVLLTDLLPDTEYTYRLGSDEFSFRSPKAPGKQHNGRLVALGNMGIFHDHHVHRNGHKNGAATRQVSTATTGLLQHLQKDVNDPAMRPDLMVHLGNLAYASGRSFIWDYFLHAIKPLASQLPYHVIAGEMEMDFDVPGKLRNNLASWAMRSNASGGECGVPLSHRFNMPESIGSNGVFWYGHAVSNIYIVYISTEHNLSPGSEQLRWLDMELGRVDRQQYPWLFVAGHRPLYTNNRQDGAVADTLQKHLNPILHKHMVNLYMAGHESRYTRSCVINKHGACIDGHAEPSGVVHVTCGSSGAPQPTGKVQVAAWIKVQIQQHGYLDISTAGAGEATLKFRGVDGRVLDEVLLENRWRETTTVIDAIQEVVPIEADGVAEFHDYSSASCLSALSLLKLMALLSFTTTARLAACLH